VIHEACGKLGNTASAIRQSFAAYLNLFKYHAEGYKGEYFEVANAIT
jgi:hypothetical protein